MLIVDAQVHVWKPEGPDRPWPPGGAEWAAKGHRPDPISGEQLLKEMDAAGVDAAVLVPPFFEGYRNDYAMEVAQAHPDRFRLMPRVDLRADDAEDHVRRVADEKLTPGIRLLFLPQDAGRLADGAADWLWPVAEDLGLPVMLLAPNQASELAEIARRHPNLRLAVDHLGLSGANKDDAIAGEIDALVGLSSLPNVSVKATSVMSYSTEPYPFPSLHPHLERVVEAFGPQRVFWGSDLSRKGVSYEPLISLFRDELSFLDGDDLEAVMGKSLCSWLGWSPGA